MELSVKKRWNKYCEESEVDAEESRKNQGFGEGMREKLWGRQLKLGRESWRSGVETQCSGKFLDTVIYEGVPGEGFLVTGIWKLNWPSFVFRKGFQLWD